MRPERGKSTMARPDRNVRQEHLAIDNPSVSHHLISLLAAERDRVPPPSADGWASLRDVVAQKNWERPAGERLKLLVTPNVRPAFATPDSPWWKTAQISRAAAVILLLLSVGILGFGVVSAAGKPIPIPSFSIPNLPLIGNSESKVQGTVQWESGNRILITNGNSKPVQVSLKPGTALPPVGRVVTVKGRKSGGEVQEANITVEQPVGGQQATPTPTVAATRADSAPTPAPAQTPYPLTPLTDATPGGLAAILARPSAAATGTNTPVPTASPTPSPTRLPLSWGGSLPIAAPPPPRPVGVPAPIVILPLPSNIGIPATPPVARPNTPANGVTGLAGAGSAGAASVPGVTGAPASGVAPISQPPLGGRGTTVGSGTGSVATQPSQPVPAATPVAPAQGGRPSAGGGSDTAGGAAAAAAGAGLLGVPVPTATSTSATPPSAIPHPAQGGTPASASPAAPSNPLMLGVPAPSPAPVAPLTPPVQGGRPLGGASTGNGPSPSAAPGRGTAPVSTELLAGPALLGLPASIVGPAPTPPLRPSPGGPDGAVAASAPMTLPLGLAQAALPAGPVTHSGPSVPASLTMPLVPASLTLLGLPALAPQQRVGPSLITPQVIGIQLCPPSTTGQQALTRTTC